MAAEVRRRAWLQGIDPWSASFSTSRFERLLRRALRRRTPSGEELVGVGEIAARCHSHAASIAAHGLRWQAPARRCAAWLSDAAAASRHSPEAPGFRAVAHAQLVSHGAMDWRTQRAAENLLDRPWEVRSDAYGMVFVLALMLRLAPARALSRRVLRASPAGPLLKAIVSELSRSESPENLIRALLRAATPGLRLIGAAALNGVRSGDRQVGLDKGLIHGRYEQLGSAGWAWPDSLWIASIPLKEAGHARFRAQHRLEALELERRAIEIDPAKAIGGASYASARLDRLAVDIPQAQTALLQAAEELDILSQELAGCWPDAEMTTEQMSRLNDIFVMRGGVRRHVAAAMPRGAARDALLDRTLAEFDELLGLDDVATAFREYFFKDGAEVFQAAAEAAQTMHLRYEADSKGPGRRTGQRLEPLSTAAERLLSQPFIAARRPAARQSAMSKFACALIFALDVVSATPATRIKDMSRLVKMTLSHARSLLSMSRDEELCSPYLEQLALMSVLRMSSDPACDARVAWAADGSLPAFARAMAIWSDPAALMQDAALAESLFDAAARPALHLSPGRCGYARTLSLLDLALASCRSDPALLEALARLWKRARARFEPHKVDLSLGGRLLAAAWGEPDDVAWLRADPRLRTTMTAQLGG